VKRVSKDMAITVIDRLEERERERQGYIPSSSLSKENEFEALHPPD
jgi:hypothetical protein